MANDSPSKDKWWKWLNGEQIKGLPRPAPGRGGGRPKRSRENQKAQSSVASIERNKNIMPFLSYPYIMSCFLERHACLIVVNKVAWNLSLCHGVIHLNSSCEAERIPSAKWAIMSPFNPSYSQFSPIRRLRSTKFRYRWGSGICRNALSVMSCHFPLKSWGENSSSLQERSWLKLRKYVKSYVEESIFIATNYYCNSISDQHT